MRVYLARRSSCLLFAFITLAISLRPPLASACFQFRTLFFARCISTAQRSL